MADTHSDPLWVEYTTVTELIEFITYAIESISLGFDRWDEEHVRGPGLYFVVVTGLLVLVLLSASLMLTVIEVVIDILTLGGSMVGIVTIGVAAALPELTAVMDAIRRRSPNVALGTLVGSNIVNPLVGFGMGGAISTYYVPPAVVLWDLPFKLVTGAGLLGWALYVRDGQLTWTEGGYLLGLYFVFVVGRLLLFPGQ